jgi:hypothetical protein
VHASMVSDKRLEANRLNAQKSTGPKTDEGKARSRRNAWKHGLAGAGVVLPDEDRDKLRERVTSWTDDLQPTCPVESWLVERAAHASVRLDRCVEKETAEMAARRREAVGEWERREREWVNKAIPELTKSPAKVVRQLERSALGCDWLLETWEGLDRKLQMPGCWNERLVALALCLRGQAPNLAGDPDGIRLYALIARGPIDPDAVDALSGVSTAHLDPEARLKLIETELPDRATAQRALAAIVTAAVRRLDAARAQAWIARDRDSLAEASGRVAFDGTPDAALMQRYETAHSLDLHRCLNQLAKLRKLDSRDARPAVADPATAPAAPLEIHSPPPASPVSNCAAPSPTAAAREAGPASATAVRNEPTASGADAGTALHQTGSSNGTESPSGSPGVPGASGRELENGARAPREAARRPSGVLAQS